MGTTYRTPEKYADILQKLVWRTDTCGSIRPKRFMRVMKENRGIVSRLSLFDMPEDGLERKNPLVVALGDSVTAGYFEMWGGVEDYFKRMDEGLVREDECFMVMDVRECYLEKFRNRLIDYYGQTPVSTVNSGIAGDTMYGMEKRVHRDVIRYQPDLVIINGSLNWGPECGSTENYEAVLTRVIDVIQEETKADVIILTPNMAKIPEINFNPKSCLEERVEVIRKLTEEKSVCLADNYKVWKAYEMAGYPVSLLLANGTTHPSNIGHEVYADVLMKLINETNQIPAEIACDRR